MTWNETYLKSLQNLHNDQLYVWQAERLDVFLSQGFPNRKVENWKYTNVAGIEKQDFSFDKPVDCDISNFILNDVYRVVFVNGHFSSALSDLSQLPFGVLLSSLKTTQRETIKNLISGINYEMTPFSLLNDSVFQDGLFLYVPKNCQLKKPIHLIYLTKPTQPLVMSQTRHLIIIEEKAKAIIFENYQGTHDVTYFNNLVTQVRVKPSANLHLYKLQQEGNKAFHIANTTIHQAQDSQVMSCHVVIGGSLSRDDLNYSLDESGASCQLFGFYHLKDSHHVDNHSRIDHRVSRCISQQNYKGIVVGRSRAVFNGKIVVHPNAGQTEAHQTNKNLLLSTEAEIDTKPELEIYNDDVKCSHGATVGQLNDTALFYLQSRGIDRVTAEYMLTYAFANEIIEVLPHPLIAEYMKKGITQQLATSCCQGHCHAQL
ncbi:Fe-S cluster assembly protein SufD [Coxiella endosymbiont of Amblyomma nuttalli]|uniref:Fe-S cluster assembly protein SufD n=1 Tax=Coxiella endosymbiont of Amblyomma nuttalli TaxID=2749996 RepID=UPI001BAE2AD5|nr:Fe-S cluster assembly protein SufD [Coxiella endosymbiont of Amblyomma nuttalli]QTS83852.1 FeS cluster assembly protein SufD [Coxiella endosymbiont of Amblyomma nuttalli]